MDVFLSTFFGVLRVFTIMLGAGLLVRRKIISQMQVKALTDVTVKVFLPCLIFSNITSTFDPSRMSFWWVLPLVAVGMIFFGVLFGRLVFWGDMPAKRNMTALTGLQNAGYLILPIGGAMYSGQDLDRFVLQCFLFMLGVTPLLWSLGKHLITTDAREPLSWKGLITPPFVASILALLLVFSKASTLIPDVLAGSMKMLGSATIPITTFILGSVLGGVTLRLRHHMFDAFRVMSVKLLFVPLVMVIILRLIALRQHDSLMADLLVLQAASAPATALILQVKHYGGDEEKVGSIMFLSYLACVVTIPFWMAMSELQITN